MKTQSNATPFDKFRQFAQKVISVPKAEIDRREKEYKRARKKMRRGGL